MSQQIYALIHYDVSALPQTHPKASLYNVRATQLPNKKYVLQDSFGLFVTKESKHDADGAIQPDSPYFEDFCLIEEYNVINVAIEFVKNLKVDGITADQVLECDYLSNSGLSDDDIQDFLLGIRNHQENMREYYENDKFFVNPEEVHAYNKNAEHSKQDSASDSSTGKD